MNKREFAKELLEKTLIRPGLYTPYRKMSIHFFNRLIDQFMEIIFNTCEQGDVLRLKNYGTFRLTFKDEAISKSPITGNRKTGKKAKILFNTSRSVRKDMANRFIKNTTLDVDDLDIHKLLEKIS